MTLTDLALREAALKTLADTIRDELTVVKREMGAALAESGATQAAALLPDGTKVGTSSLSVPRPSARVVDEAAFTEWVADHAPAETETVVRPAYRKSLLARMTGAGVPEVADPGTGEITPVPGVEISVGARTHTVRLTADGAARIAAAWRDGQLDVRLLDLPQIIAGGGQ